MFFYFARKSLFLASKHTLWYIYRTRKPQSIAFREENSNRRPGEPSSINRTGWESPSIFRKWNCHLLSGLYKKKRHPRPYRVWPFQYRKRCYFALVEKKNFFHFLGWWKFYGNFLLLTIKLCMDVYLDLNTPSFTSEHNLWYIIGKGKS